MQAAHGSGAWRSPLSLPRAIHSASTARPLFRFDGPPRPARFSASTACRGLPAFPLRRSAAARRFSKNVEIRRYWANSCDMLAILVKICQNTRAKNKKTIGEGSLMEAERLLLDVGLRASRRGYAQAVAILRILRDQPELEHLSEAYAMAGQQLHASPQQIERNLRVAIREAWETGNKPLLRRLLPWCSECCPPETKEFLYALAARLRTGFPTG